MNSRAWILPAYQRAALVVSYQWYRITRRGRAHSISWVVGPDECASMVHQLSQAIPKAYSVNFSEETVYGYEYDFKFRTRRESRWRWLERKLAGPWVLGRLMNEARGFIYVGATGFLMSDADHREFEFSYLAKKNLPIVCYWCGSDIRSVKKMHDFEREVGFPNVSTYMGERGAIYESQAWDDEKRGLAEVASRYARAMFSNTVDHLSYLTVGTEPFLYFLEDRLTPDFEKFGDVANPVIVHATTAPSIKGTALVRAAISQLREEDYVFEYVELIGVPNARVKSELNRAHIAMNQFYGFSPAVFGVESLASGCVVMMSADETVESDLPAGSNDCWVVTKHHQVYRNLKALLDDPSRWEAIARRGREWAEQYGLREGASEILLAKLNSVLEGTYQAPAVRS